MKPRVGWSCLRAEQAPGEEDVALPQGDPQPFQTLSSLTGGLADAACRWQPPQVLSLHLPPGWCL